MLQDQSIDTDIRLIFNKWKEEERLLVDDYDNSILRDLEIFNLASLQYEEGIVVMETILNLDNAVQGIASRMKRLEATCYMKYGKRELDKYKKKCYAVLRDVFNIPQNTIDKLIARNPCLWVCVLFSMI